MDKTTELNNATLELGNYFQNKVVKTFIVADQTGIKTLYQTHSGRWFIEGSCISEAKAHELLNFPISF